MAEPPKPAPRTRGAKSKLTPEVQELIVNTTIAGATFRDACLVVDIDPSTAFRWLQKGEAQKRGKYRNFRNAIEAAKARRRTGNLAKLRQFGQRDWRALEAHMNRTDPETRPDLRVHVSTELDATLDKLEGEFKDEPQTWERVLRAISGASKSDEGGSAPPSASERSDSEEAPP